MNPHMTYIRIYPTILRMIRMKEKIHVMIFFPPNDKKSKTFQERFLCILKQLWLAPFSLSYQKKKLGVTSFFLATFVSFVIPSFLQLPEKAKPLSTPKKMIIMETLRYKKNRTKKIDIDQLKIVREMMKPALPTFWFITANNLLHH